MWHSLLIADGCFIPLLANFLWEPPPSFSPWAVVIGAKLSDSAAVCDAKETEADGILGNLLAGGLLNCLPGNSNSVCAKSSLIGSCSSLLQEEFEGLYR
ncbi:unnamed protein product [Penicillium camemberti]|uniref:Str. FM013 n=1 Tax=Penicillium camemberti (strain FM 013) TaxID=1429867 RepID=A0A0G4PSY9_PENC3|nr:unnamed protein product [Penicillium camemberti]